MLKLHRKGHCTYSLRNMTHNIHIEIIKYFFGPIPAFKVYVTLQDYQYSVVTKI